MRRNRIQNPESRIRKSPGAARLALFCILTSGFWIPASGCNIFGLIAHKTVGPPPVPAQFVLPPAEPVLVLVENYRNPAPTRLDADRLARHIAAEFERHRIAPTVAPGAFEAVAARPDYATMTQGRIGQAAGARRVVYVDLLKFNVENAMASEMIKGQVEMTVRVVDAQTGRTDWPTDTPEGHLMSFETPYLRTGPGTGRTGGGPGANEAGLRDGMCRKAAAEIGRLFRKWKPDEEWVAGEQ